MGEQKDASIALKRPPALVTSRWNRPTKFACALVAAAAYLLVAHWLKISYVPPIISKIEPTVTGTKSLLRRPFVRFLNSDFGVIAQDKLFVSLADSADNNERSPIEIYEDDKRLEPAHSVHADVAKIGHGRFSHWRNDGAIFIFSSSDNSDPQTNGRAYWAVRPNVPDSRSEP
jgi:hypothetical protein